MPIAPVNHIDMYYQQKGQGPELVIITGLSSNHTAWLSVAEVLASHFRVTLFDNRGAGQTAQPSEPYTAALMAQDTVELMNHLKIDSAFMIGHSMGGQILQMIASNYPEKLRAGILLGTTARFPKIVQMLFENTIKMFDARVSPEIILGSSFPWLYANSFLEQEDNIQAEVKRIVSDQHPQGLDGYKGQVNALQLFNDSAKVSQINRPMLVVGGSEDLLAPVSHQEHLHRSITNSQMKIIDDCAHMFQVEKPKELTEIIIDYFK